MIMITGELKLRKKVFLNPNRKKKAVEMDGLRTIFRIRRIVMVKDKGLRELFDVKKS